jgi:acyl-homoserine lactone acylase PvdQ
VVRGWRRLLDTPGPRDAVLSEALEVLRRWDRRAAPDSPAAALALLTLEPGHRNEALPDAGALARRLRSAAQDLRRHFGTLAPPLPDMLRLRRGALDLGLDGGPDLLHAFYARPGANGRWGAYAGDSFVMIVEWDAAGAVRSRSIHQFGACTSRPSSPHFADQAPLFARHQFKPVWLDEADVRANLEREYRPGE